MTLIVTIDPADIRDLSSSSATDESRDRERVCVCITVYHTRTLMPANLQSLLSYVYEEMQSRKR